MNFEDSNIINLENSGDTIEIAHEVYSVPNSSEILNTSIRAAINSEVEISDIDFDTTNENEPVISAKNNDEQTETIACEFSGQSFKPNSDLVTHYRIHTNNKVDMRSDCNKTNPFYSNLDKHMDHSNERPFECDVCKNSFKTKKAFKDHYKRHSDDKKFKCNVCNKSFHFNYTLSRHQIVHSELRPYVCHLCNRTFKLKASLLKHSLIHSDEKKNVCEVCNKAFRHRSDLLLHTRGHTGEKPYVCEVCKKSFLTKNHLRMHSVTHSEIKEHTCPKCEKSFHITYIRRHVNRCKGLKMKDSEEDRYVCTVCNKKFTKAYTLKRHGNIHLSEKMYTCHMCGKGFNFSHSLKSHIYMHEETEFGLQIV